jgi:Protein of unknown function (DUF3306)
MSEQEKFLDRWSRRKRDAAGEPAADLPAPAEAKDGGKDIAKDTAEDTAKVLPSSGTETKARAAEVPFDPASLPPIESITAESDIRAFLKPGVPPELARAALRRAWSADPAIRDFIGLIENPWDFNDPHGVPGFGPMPVGENIASLLAQAIGTPPPEQHVAPQQPALGQDDSEQNSPPVIISESPHALLHDQPASIQDLSAREKVFVRRSESDAATQNDSADRESSPTPGRRGHGGALPK